ncbi:hypothetical protein XF30_21205 [Bradyrhizobium sp. SUTN9-2]|uniref:hypothetical protein n=1 Tax=Bradyrhizobium sp. SUTN9-2 TaxID=1167456 RepID=UPI000D64E11C|nr:hypothetical protein [Bradyrhizobium sp. SUTN9-2]PWE78886.1 hypothetical protein XF30_21205 [Bradyrhizobium sp. SUTN9-2]
MPISKLEAAQRQLDCAIRLFINGEELLAVHALSRAAFRVLYDIYPSYRDDGFSTDLGKFIEVGGWKRFNDAANFLKHTDRDPTAQGEVSEPDTQMGIGFGIVLHHRLTGTHTPEMKAFDAWMKALHPDEFKVPPDPDPDIEKLSRDAIEVVKAAPRNVQLRLAKGLLTVMKENPDWPKLKA